MPKFATKSPLFGDFLARIFKNYCHIWNQHLRISVIAKFWEEKKMPKFGTKKALFRYFGTRTLENYCHIWNQHVLELVLLQNFMEKQKCVNLGPKILLWRIFDQECLIWIFLGKNYLKTIVRFEISTLEYV